MSLSRAFTTRRLRLSSNTAADGGGEQPRRSNSIKGSILRHKISAPIQLIHTTNMLSYNAPDIPRASRSISSSTTARSDEDSDAHTVDSTPPTSPESASDKERSPSPEPNHLTTYFRSAARPAAAPSEEQPPKIPQRSPSHTKKNSFEAIARSRSVSRLSRDSDLSLSVKVGQPFSRSPSTSTRASSVSHTSSPLSAKQSTPPPTAPASATTGGGDGHPFGQELAKVHELAEEYSVDGRLAVIDEEQQYLDVRGLVKLTADDYLSVIQSLSSAFFPSEAKHAVATTPLWI